MGWWAFALPWGTAMQMRISLQNQLATLPILRRIRKLSLRNKSLGRPYFAARCFSRGNQIVRILIIGNWCPSPQNPTVRDPEQSPIRMLCNQARLIFSFAMVSAICSCTFGALENVELRRHYAEGYWDGHHRLSAKIMEPLDKFSGTILWLPTLSK